MLQETTRKKKLNLTEVYDTGCRGPAPCAWVGRAETCERDGGRVVGQSVASLSVSGVAHAECAGSRGFTSYYLVFTELAFRKQTSGFTLPADKAQAGDGPHPTSAT